ncbi:MAG TPA: hypothetical protein VEW64_06710 [Methyloceanibacter sp.]|nr:hypothetical protein [Methyloceanibacter sp.]
MSHKVRVPSVLLLVLLSQATKSMRAGFVSLPLIGAVRARGLTTFELSNDIAA